MTTAETTDEMMTSPDTLRLTDDEAAAIAILASGAWRTPLPTVNEASDADLAAAVLRGRRSLVVRDLAEPDGTPVAEAAEVLKRLGTGPRALFMVVGGDGAWIPSGFTVYLYGATVAEIEMSHLVAASGVHYFRVAPPPGQWGALTGLAEAIFADGFTAADGGPQPAAAVLNVVRPDGVRGVRVARGSATSGRGPVPASFPSVADAISWLVA